MQRRCNERVATGLEIVGITSKTSSHLEYYSKIFIILEI